MISRTWFGELPYNLVVAIALLLWAPSFVASVCSLTSFAILKTLHVLCLERIQKMSGVTIVRAIQGSTLVWAIILPGAHFLYKVSSNLINSRGGVGVTRSLPRQKVPLLQKHLHSLKLDGVGPIDNRPSTD